MTPYSAGKPSLTGVHFESLAWLQRVRLGGGAWFTDAHFGGAKISESDERPRSADFTEAQFSGLAAFQAASFGGDAVFRQTQFDHGALFHGVQVSGSLEFSQAQFVATDRLGPLVAAHEFQLDRT
jgi:uncharacterized protein YjbI with pentapeptide repeats